MKTNILIIDKTDQDNLNTLLALYRKCRTVFGTLMKTSAKYKHLADWLITKTPLLSDKKYNWTTRLYWVANGLTDFPICPICGKVKLEKNTDSFEKGYYRAHNADCAAANPERQEKTHQTFLKKYGSANYLSSEEGKRRRDDWCRRNGVQNSFQLESVKKKAAESRKKHFGYEYTMQSPEKRELASQNYKAKTGFDHQFCNPETKQKIKQTIDRKRSEGIDIYAKRRRTNRCLRYQNFIGNDEIMPLFSLDDFLELDSDTQYTTLLSWKCKKCGTEFKAYIDQNFSSRFALPVRCEKCHPFTIEHGTSANEQRIQAYVHNICNDSIDNSRKIISPYELDIYIPSRKIAFEYDGLHWHSDDNAPDNYHLMKTDMCAQAGIHLIHIFEDEWLEHRDIVKSRIDNMLGLHKHVVFARKCFIEVIDAKTSNEFQERTHIQGAVNAKVNLGLFNDDKLIALMTFGKSRFNKKYEWELLRFCTELEYHIPGGASKLLKYFEQHYSPKSLISYADRRWSQGKLYNTLGFALDHISAPTYWYCKDQCRYSRIRFQKHKLKLLLPAFDENLSEIENMKNNKYSRIFDCGNYVFIKDYTNII